MVCLLLPLLLCGQPGADAQVHKEKVVVPVESKPDVNWAGALLHSALCVCVCVCVCLCVSVCVCVPHTTPHGSCWWGGLGRHHQRPDRQHHPPHRVEDGCSRAAAWQGRTTQRWCRRR